MVWYVMAFQESLLLLCIFEGASARWFGRTSVVRTCGDDRGYGSVWFGSVRILEFSPASRNATFY
jgi:hypothetical protein